MKVSEKVRTICYVVEGGIGKNLAATAVIKSIKTAYPDKRIIVIAGCPEVFFYNPNVYKTFNFNNPLYFYEDYINEETVIFKTEPYLDYDYMNKTKHLIECWCEDFGVPCVTKVPDLYFLENELDAAKIWIDEKTEKKRGIVFIQWIGGKIPEDKSKQQLKFSVATMFRRALPLDTIKEVVEELIKKEYAVGIVGHENFPQIEKTEKVFFPIRSTIALFKHATTFIGVDSFMQHACASDAIDKRGIVCWGGTSPISLGYNKHVNLVRNVCPTPFCHRPNSYCFDIQQHGAMWDCIHGEQCMKYSSKKILETFDENFPDNKIIETKKEEVTPSTCGENCKK